MYGQRGRGEFLSSEPANKRSNRYASRECCERNVRVFRRDQRVQFFEFHFLHLVGLYFRNPSQIHNGLSLSRSSRAPGCLSIAVGSNILMIVARLSPAQHLTLWSDGNRSLLHHAIHIFHQQRLKDFRRFHRTRHTYVAAAWTVGTKLLHVSTILTDTKSMRFEYQNVSYLFHEIFLFLVNLPTLSSTPTCLDSQYIPIERNSMVSACQPQPHCPPGSLLHWCCPRS